MATGSRTNVSFDMESIEATCKDRRERTVKLSLDSEGRPYGRKEVLDGLL